KRHRQRLHRLPAIERIAIVRGKEAKVIGVDRQNKLDGRRKAAVERRYRPLGDADEDEALARLLHLDNPALDLAAVEHERQVAAIAADQPDGKRNYHRVLVRLS